MPRIKLNTPLTLDRCGSANLLESRDGKVEVAQSLVALITSPTAQQAMPLMGPAQQSKQATIQTLPKNQNQLPGASIAPHPRSFYKRRLLPPAIPFSSPEGEKIFHEALVEGTMKGFFKLIEQYSTQDEPAFCGLASVCMVLNALGVDPRRTWKGPWRWFHEEMLDCCKPVEMVKQSGITLSQAACTAHCNGAVVELRMFGTFSLEQFRASVIAACRSELDHLVVSYSRQAVQQTGDGHFSPLGGYHPGQDLVLILDVARFKYPPHWVPLTLLYKAMSLIDPETQKPRGFMRLAAQTNRGSVLFTLNVDHSAWQDAELFARTTGPQWMQLLSAGGELGASEVLRHLADMVPLASLDAFVSERDQAHHNGPCAASSTGSCVSCTPSESREQLLSELRSLPLHNAVRESMFRRCKGLRMRVSMSGRMRMSLSGNASTVLPASDGTVGAGCLATQAAPAATQGSNSSAFVGQAVPSATHTNGSSVPFQAAFSAAAQRAYGVSAFASQAAAPMEDAESEEDLQSEHVQRCMELADKACMLLMVMMLRPASPVDFIAGPSNRTTRAAPMLWASPAAQQDWEQLLDISSSSLVEAELAFLWEQLGLLDNVLRSPVHATKPCTTCTNRLDCLALGHNIHPYKE